MFDTSEIRDLVRDLTDAPEGVGKKVQTVVRKTALDIKGTARKIVPVDTGTLQDSIRTSDLRKVGTSGDIQADVGPTTDYGQYVEFGTSRQRPQPYMGPALDKHADAFEKAIDSILGDALG